MSTEQTKTAVFTTSPQMNALSIFVAVVLGSSLIEFNELLFPPRLSSMAFWGIVPCYWVAVTGWLPGSTQVETCLASRGEKIVLTSVMKGI